MTDALLDVQKSFDEIDEGLFEFVPLQPKIFVNSFPKSGTHLANLISQHLAHQQTPKHWLGSFRGHSWTTKWIPINSMLSVIKGQQPGTWYQGHVGYKKILDDSFNRNNVCMLFIYRDLRDVAVSLAYHIEMADNETKFHPGKDEFLALGDHTDILRAVILGLGEYKGVVERWKLYAPWLDVPWVLPIKYEDMIHNPRNVAEKAVTYITARTLQDTIGVVLEGNIIDAIVRAEKSLGTTDHSSSYRKGKSGEWRNEFTPELVELFKQTDDEQWTERLGYEDYRDSW